MEQGAWGGATYVIKKKQVSIASRKSFTTIHSRKGTWNDKTNSPVKPLYLKKIYKPNIFFTIK